MLANLLYNKILTTRKNSFEVTGITKLFIHLQYKFMDKLTWMFKSFVVESHV